eukprot:GFUD01035897.1.p1 GENE.GFUD01035897.1~~GFUD01035897.1.p1  ORF type:complete len:251 (-),score=86.15 GFUD01035897.1:89-841(-)
MTTILTLPSHMTGFLHELGTQSGIYSYVSKPRMVSPNRPKTQGSGPSLQERPLSLMSDRRVVRGNTYRGAVTADGSYIRRTGPRNTIQDRRPIFRTPHTYNLKPANFTSLGPNPLPSRRLVPGGIIPPVPGRKHMDLQTEMWLEEIADRKEEKHVAVQATPQETFNEVSSPTSQVVASSGPREDKETQIYNNDPHLFVFDKEVEVVMEAILGRTLEQSMMEVMQEEEMARAREFKQQHMEGVTALAVNTG